MNLTLLKSLGHKYNYVALLSTGHLVCFGSGEKIGTEVQLKDVTVDDHEVRVLSVNEMAIIATGELAWQPEKVK